MILLLVSVAANAVTLETLNSALGGKDRAARATALTYITAVVQTIHDIDEFNQNEGRIRNVCLSDGLPMSDKNAMSSGQSIWNGLIADIKEQGDAEERLKMHFVHALIEYLDRTNPCGMDV